MDELERHRVDELWGEYAERGGSQESFQEIEYVREVYQRRTYPRGKDFLDAVAAHANGPFRSLLVLGCGSGISERNAYERGLASHALGIDLSSRALAEAARRAEQLGWGEVRYLCADLNDPPKDLGRFHVILTPSSLHHIVELEHFLDWVASSLEPDGIFAGSEYVGPACFQWNEAQVRMTAEVLDLIPHPYRTFVDGRVKEHAWSPTREEVLAVDPTEAVRSDEILPLLEQRFAIAERHDIGGGLLFPLLQGIAHHYDHADPTALALLRFLLYLDDLALRTKHLPNTITDWIARPR
jgi:SAM-dependent methyltransferase